MNCYTEIAKQIPEFMTVATDIKKNRLPMGLKPEAVGGKGDHRNGKSRYDGEHPGRCRGVSGIVVGIGLTEEGLESVNRNQQSDQKCVYHVFCNSLCVKCFYIVMKFTSAFVSFKN